MRRLWIFAAASLIFATLAFAQREPQARQKPTPEQQILQALTGQVPHHENDRVTAEGKVSRFTPERDGYRVQLENDHESYFVPRSRLGGHDLSIGIRLRLGGIFRGGMIYVDDFGWNEPYGRDYRDHRDETLRGTVIRVNYRLGSIVVRASNGDTIRVDTRDIDSRGPALDIGEIRRGDTVEIRGDWARDDLFHANRVYRARRVW
jgi:hypothetical protein